MGLLLGFLIGMAVTQVGIVVVVNEDRRPTTPNLRRSGGQEGVRRTGRVQLRHGAIG